MNVISPDFTFYSSFISTAFAVNIVFSFFDGFTQHIYKWLDFQIVFSHNISAAELDDSDKPSYDRLHKNISEKIKKIIENSKKIQGGITTLFKWFSAAMAVVCLVLLYEAGFLLIYGNCHGWLWLLICPAPLFMLASAILFLVAHRRVRKKRKLLNDLYQEISSSYKLNLPI